MQFMPKVGVGSAESAVVLRYCEHFGLCRTTQQPEKETAKKCSRTTRTPIGLAGLASFFHNR